MEIREIVNSQPICVDFDLGEFWKKYALEYYYMLSLFENSTFRTSEIFIFISSE